MNQFQKNVLFIAGALICVVLVCFGVNFGIQAHNRSLQEQAQKEADRKLAWKKDNIRALKGLSAVGAFSPGEQTRIDNAGDDLDRLQQVLLDIHQERVNYWQNDLEDAQQRRKKLDDLSMYANYSYAGQVQDAADSITSDEDKAKENLAGYVEALGRIRDWRPSDLKSFRPDQSSPGTAPSFVAKPSPGTPQSSAVVQDNTTSLRPISTTSLPSTAEVALDNIDTQVRAALDHWAAAMQTNDPVQEASCYASTVDRYFLRLNVTNDFVRDYMTTWLGSNDRRISKFQPQDITIESESPDQVKLRLVKDVVEIENGAPTERFTRSRLYLRREADTWKISSEQDFK
jgi:hypothetical protein